MRPIELGLLQGAGLLTYEEVGAEPSGSGCRSISGYLRAELCADCDRIRLYGVSSKVRPDVIGAQDLPIPATVSDPRRESLPLASEAQLPRTTRAG